MFEGVGSTQTRKTTFQRHHVLERPKRPAEVAVTHLLASAAHLGHHRRHGAPASWSYIHGTREGIHVIDVRQTLSHLRRAADVVRGVVENDGIVVFLSSTPGTEAAVRKAAERLGPNGFAATRWTPGTISNAAKIFEQYELDPTARIDDDADMEPGERRRSEPGRPTPYAFTPSVLISFSPRLNRSALAEATNSRVLTIGVIDTDVDPRVVTYPIPANDDSPRTIELIAGVLGMAGQEGRERREARCVAPPADLADLAEWV